MTYDNASKYASCTVLNLLSCLSPKLDNSLPALLIGNIFISVLKISLASTGIQRTGEDMNDFGVTSTYHELLCFKKSVAVAAAKNAEMTAISKAEDGLHQIVVDNFDADIASQNGKLSTHSLAVLLTQFDVNTLKTNEAYHSLRKLR